MSEVPSRRRFVVSSPAIPLNSEKIRVETTTLPVTVPESTWLDDQYDVIGGRHGGNLVRCLDAGNAALGMAALRQHDLNRALITICWHLTKKVVEDDLEYEIICELERWVRRRRRPKPDDELAKRCHFLAILMFSTDASPNDNVASKNGRVVEQLIRSGVTEEHILEHLNRPGGVGAVYQEALEQHPRATRRSTKSRDRARSNTAASPGKSSTLVELIDNKFLRVLGRLAEIHTDHGEIKALIIFTTIDDYAILSEMNPGDEFKALVESIDHEAGCILLCTSEVRPLGKTK